MAKKRGFETALDMLRSMGLLAVFIAFVLVVTWRPWTSSSITPVNLSAEASAAQKAVAFEVLNPTLPSGWKVNGAYVQTVANDLTHHVWMINMIAADDSYVSIQQTDTEGVDGFVRSITGVSTLSVLESQWQPIENSDGANVTYVKQLTDSVAIVTLPKDRADLLKVVEGFLVF